MQAHWHDIGISSATGRTSCQGTPFREHKAKEGDREEDRKGSTAEPIELTLISKDSTPVTRGHPRGSQVDISTAFNVPHWGPSLLHMSPLRQTHPHHSTYNVTYLVYILSKTSSTLKLSSFYEHSKHSSLLTENRN